MEGNGEQVETIGNGGKCSKMRGELEFQNKPGNQKTKQQHKKDKTKLHCGVRIVKLLQ